VRASLPVLVLFVVALRVGAATSTASQPGFNTLVCNDVNQTGTTDPTFTTPTPATRLVLGRVRLPKSSILLGRNRWRRPIPPGQDAFIKFGITVSAGPPVSLSVPLTAQDIYALNFNNPAATVAASKTNLLITPCPKSDGPATAWPGGYLLKHPACVPLIIHVGARTTRVSLALGRPC
jgi:hypothetical protein